VLLLPNFQRSFSLFIAIPFLIGSANVEAFLFPPNFIILISKFLENKRHKIRQNFLQNILRAIRFF